MYGLDAIYAILFILSYPIHSILLGVIRIGGDTRKKPLMNKKVEMKKGVINVCDFQGNKKGKKKDAKMPSAEGDVQGW